MVEELIEAMGVLIRTIRDRGITVLIVEHRIKLVMGVCDRVAVMCRGVLGEARPVGGTTENQIMMAATGGTGER